MNYPLLIDFIVCVNNEVVYEKCLSFINKLIIPEDVKINIFPIREAPGMATAYNAHMKSSKSKIKVYLHQDTFILNPGFIAEILAIFKANPKIGMLGVIGSEDVPTSGVWWDSKKCFGKVFEFRKDYQTVAFGEVNEEYKTVSIIDGLIMITQYDIPWREDIFNGWHFYDASQSLEFTKNGYLVAIPRQTTPWCLHFCGMVSINKYEDYRKLFTATYLDIA
jgi:hypothetical protein